MILFADARSVKIQPPKQKPWSALRKVLTENCTDAEITPYLASLKKRKPSGSPLIRPQVAHRPRGARGSES